MRAAMWTLCLLLSACHMLRAEKHETPALGSGIHTGMLQVGGLTRSYLLYVPRQRRAAAPLVMLLHGSRQSSEDLRRSTGYAFDRLADQHGFVAVYPQGYRGRWNDCRAGGRYAARKLQLDDVGFLLALVDELAKTVDVDPGRVFLAGYSGGGQLAFRAALERPERVTAIAAFSANLPTPENLSCTPESTPVSALLINGTRDRINPFAGGRVSVFGFASRGHVRSAEDSAAYFAARAGVRTFARESVVESRELWLERSRWYEPGKPEVMLLSVHGGGHVIPGPDSAFPRILGKVSRLLDAPREAWSFFARQPARTPPAKP